MSIITGRRMLALIAASMLMAQTGGALAEGQQAVDTVVVHGAYVIHKTIRSVGHPFYPETEYLVSQVVSYGDLNLATQRGMDMFWSRVNVTAKNLCGELDKLSPASFSQEQECVATSMHNAIVKVTDTLAASLERQQKVASLH